MTLLALILLQAASDLPPIDFDLAKRPSSKGDCVGSGGNAVVVCARRRPPDAGRIDPEGTGLLLPRAEVGLFGKARASLNTGQSSVGGFTAPEAKVTITIPF